MRKVANGLLPVLLPIGLMAAIGCGGNSSKPNIDTTGPYVPLKVGNEWRYDVIETDGTVSAKIQTVTAMGMVGGTGPAATTTAFKLVTGDKPADENGDVSYQNWAENGRLVRYREISVGGSSGRTKKEEYYDGMYKLRVWDDAEHTAMGARWIEAYKTFTVDTPKTPDDAGTANGDGGVTADAGLVTTDEMTSEVWSVAAVDEEVTVPAGTFKALVLEKIVAANSSDKKFWFVRGVGKVKETGVGEQTEELTRFTVMK